MMVYAGVSARQTGKALEVFNLVFGKLTDDIPSYQTALDWVKKCGLSVYENARRRPSLREVDYSIIMDNSITIGGQDGKDGEYSELVQKIGYARKYGHTPIAHLMPPRRRAYARFMNVFDSIQWAHDIMQSDFKLPALARHLFGFVNTHASLFEEMQEVMDAYRYMEHLCKEKGLSRTTAAECISHIGKTLMPGGERPRRLGGLLIGYFRKEASLLEEDAVHNISSDVIESAFGYIKNRMSSCANHGFTSLILLMPLHFRLADIDCCADFNISDCLQSTSLTKLNEWKRESLMQNMSQNYMLVSCSISLFTFARTIPLTILCPPFCGL